MKKRLLLILAVLFSLTACSSFYEKDAKRVPKDAELVMGALNRASFYDMEEIESRSQLICIVKPVKNKGQVYTSWYDETFGKEICSSGYTNFDVEILEVFKGDLKAGDVIEMEQGYFIWEEENVTQIISQTGTYPLEEGQTYLMFLAYGKEREHYYAVGDCEGLHIVPSKDIQKKVQDDTLTIEDIRVRADAIELKTEYLKMYKEMIKKYIK